MKVLFTYRAKSRDKGTTQRNTEEHRGTQKRKERNDLASLLAIIATGATAVGILLGSATFAVVGVSMYLIPIYVSICGNKYF